MDEESKKQLIRLIVTQTRKLMIPARRTEASDSIVEAFLVRPEFTQSDVICMYFSLPEEVDTKPLLAAVLNAKKTAVFPRVEGDELVLHRVKSIRDFVKGAYHILEPKKTCPVVSVSGIDCFVVPGVAFDRRGHRLGMGKGYYDKLLKNTHAPKIGFAFTSQLVAQVPHTSYDVSMTAVITDEETIEVS